MTVLKISLCGESGLDGRQHKNEEQEGSMMEFLIRLRTTVARVDIVVVVEPPVMAIDADINVIADGVIAVVRVERVAAVAEI